ncbi:hypothetical protein [Pseudomonas sp. S3_H04]|jgi:predicted transcriptional regulator
MDDSKMSQQELSQRLGIYQSDVANYISDNEQTPNGGHLVYFRTTTPKALLNRLGVGDDFILRLPAS